MSMLIYLGFILFFNLAPPKVTNLKIVGDLKENSKVTVTGTVMGGTEGSSRVQWFKTIFPEFTVENDLEAVSTSKIAKVYIHIKLIFCQFSSIKHSI